jgi:hypothetical protein
MKPLHPLELLLAAIFLLYGGYLLGLHTSKGLLYTKVDVELARRAGIVEGAKAVALKCDTKAYLQEGLK